MNIYVNLCVGKKLFKHCNQTPQWHMSYVHNDNQFGRLCALIPYAWAVWTIEWENFVASIVKRQIWKLKQSIGISLSYSCITVTRPQLMPDKFTQDQWLYTKYQLMNADSRVLNVKIPLQYLLEAHQPKTNINFYPYPLFYFQVSTHTDGVWCKLMNMLHHNRVSAHP